MADKTLAKKIAAVKKLYDENAYEIQEWSKRSDPSTMLEIKLGPLKFKYEPSMGPGVPPLPPTVGDLLLTGGSLPFPPFPPAVKHLAFDYPGKTYPPFPESVTHLELSANPGVKYLPPLPPRLDILDTTDSGIVELPPLPSTLTLLFCPGCKLRQLPSLPPTLTQLVCGENQIGEIPPLPPTLTTLECQMNKLTRLPPLPLALREFTCEENNFPPALEPIYTTLQQELERLNSGLSRRTLTQEEYETQREQAVRATNEQATRYNVIPNALEQRKKTLKNTARQLLAVKTVQHERPNVPFNFLGSEIGSRVSGLPATMSLNTQYQTIKQKFPEFQPYGITQQPDVPPHIQRQVNSNTRLRLRRLLQEEKAIATKTPGQKGGARATRKHRKN